ncbi:MAG: hypothetical protein H6706_10760 [Myxococcales bacterium]|nr:hypothetical protein [Myxococcales bacterium]
MAPPALAAPRWSGLVQAEYRASQASVDELADATAAPLNQDAFTLRRARLRAEDEADWTAWVIEADFNTIDGPQAGFRQVEGAVRWRGAGLFEGLEVRLGAGVVPIPFGHEVAGQRDADRLFTERAVFADALFPGQLDVGARLAVAYGVARLTVAVQNGEPLGQAAFPGQDPNAAKDVAGRVEVAGDLSPAVHLAGGLSALTGEGFHAGTSPTKERLQWRDLNEDGIVQTSEITTLPPSAGTPSAGFDRFALGADVRVTIDVPALGPLTLGAEGALATNLDRGLRPADPVRGGRDQRALGGVVQLTQAVGPVDLGLRADVYAPHLDATEVRAGGTVRAEERWTTLTATVGARVGTGGRLVVEYQRQRDTLGRDAAGRPADLANDAVTGRLQVGF